MKINKETTILITASLALILILMLLFFTLVQNLDPTDYKVAADNIKKAAL